MPGKRERKEKERESTEKWKTSFCLWLIFSNNGIELKVIPREQKGNQIVSASAVRKALSEDDWETIYRMVPKTTLVYLKSADGEKIIRKIKMTEA